MLLLGLLEVVSYNFSEVVGVFVFQGELRVLFYGLLVADRLHADDVVPLILSFVDILIL